MGISFIAVLVFAGTTRPEKNGIYMDQMSFLVQSLSLAYDFDLKYTSADRNRFRTLGWGDEPKGMFLRQAGDTYYFAKPFVYALVAAPFTRFAPNRGALILNALLWGLLVAITYSWLSRWMPPIEAALTSLACWGLTSAFFYVFVIHADLFITALLAVALHFGFAPLAVESREGSAAHFRISTLRALCIGVLMAVMIYEKPPFVFFVAALLLFWARRGNIRSALTAITAAAVLSFAFCGVHYLEDGSITPYQGKRSVVTELDPLSSGRQDLARPASVESRKFFQASGIASLIAPKRFLAKLSYSPNFVLHLLVGRKVGAFPYMTAFLLLALLALVGLRDRQRWTSLWMLVPFVAYVAFCCVILPANYHGGPTTLGNRYALQAIPAIVFAVGYIRFNPVLFRMLLLVVAVSTVYFPGKLYASPATAVRDNYRVFQWNRMRYLPAEPELLWTGCDRYDSNFHIGKDTTVLRLSEVNERDTGNRFWMSSGSYNRLAGVSRGETANPCALQLSSLCWSVEGQIRSGSRTTDFTCGPGSVRVFHDAIQTTQKLRGMTKVDQHVWPFEIRVTSATRVLTSPGTEDCGALHVSVIPARSPDVPTSGALVIHPGDPNSEGYLAWGWYSASSDGSRWAGDTASSAFCIPARWASGRAFKLRVKAGSVGGPLAVELFAGASKNSFVLQPASAEIELPVEFPAETVDDLLLVRLVHAETRVPAVLTKDPKGDIRALTALYSEFSLHPADNPTTVVRK